MHPVECEITGDEVDDPTDLLGIDVYLSGEPCNRVWIDKNLLDDDYRTPELYVVDGSIRLFRTSTENRLPRDIRTSDRGVFREVMNLVG